MGNLGCIIYGVIMIYFDEGFEFKFVFKVVYQEKVIVFYGVFIMFIVELVDLEFDIYDFFILCIGIMVGFICLVEVMKKVNGQMNMKEVQIVYGMIEISLVLIQISLFDLFEKQVIIVGCIQLYLEIKIVDVGIGNVVFWGEIGEFCIWGYSVMLKYWNNEEKIWEVIDDNGWMYIGDLVIMDEDGYIQIVGWIKDMVICGGENIYLKEIEEFLYIYLFIEEVQVIGILDEKYGEELIVWVKLCLEVDFVDVDGLIEFCKGQIVYFKILKNYKFVDEFFMIVIGKIQKFKMWEIFIEEFGLKK